MSPTFSVVIPTYNRAEKLGKTIDSVLSQSFSDFEILVMDDGSSDKTAELIASFGDPRIIYTWEKNFGGPSKPRNRGIKLARAPWLCFLDADDWWMPNKLQACFDHLHDDVDFLYHDLVLSNDGLSGFKKIKSRNLQKPVLRDLLLRGNGIGNSSVVVRRKILEKIGGIDESVEMIAAEDFNTWLRVAGVTDKFTYLPMVLGYYLEHEQNISKKNMAIPEKFAIAEFFPHLSAKDGTRLKARLQFIEGRYLYSQGSYAKSMCLFLSAAKRGLFLIKVKSLIFASKCIFKRLIIESM